VCVLSEFKWAVDIEVEYKIFKYEFLVIVEITDER